MRQQRTQNIPAILTFCLFLYLLLTERDKRVCVLLQDKFPRQFLSSAAPRAGGICYSFQEQMALPSRFLQRAGRQKCRPWICPACINIFHAKAATLWLRKMMEKHHFLFHPKNSWTSNCSIQHIYEWSCLRDKTLVIVLKTAQRKLRSCCSGKRMYSVSYKQDLAKALFIRCLFMQQPTTVVISPFEKYYGRTNSIKLIQPFCLWIAFWL